MSPFRRLARATRHPVAQNALALNLVQAGNLFVPLVTLPYTSRVLGSDAFGLVAFSQSLSFVLGIVITWGLDGWGARDAAVLRDDRPRLSALVAQVTGARLLLSAAALAVAMGIAVLEGEPLFVGLAWVAAAATGLNPNWFFIGIERLRLVAVASLVLRVVAAALTFALVEDEADAWVVMALFSASAVATAAFAVTMLLRRVDLHRPRVRPALSAIRSSGPLFVGTAGISLYTAMNVVLIGILGTRTEVAYFSAAERIVRACMQLTGPVSVAMYPRVTYLDASGDRSRALRLLFTGGAIVAGASAVAAAGLLALAPVIIELVYGAAFAEAADVLRVMAPILPVASVTLVAGIWLMAQRLDKRVMWVTIAAGVLNVALAPYLVHRAGAVGMGVSVLTAEIVVMALACGCARWFARRGTTGPRPTATPGG